MSKDKEKKKKRDKDFEPEESDDSEDDLSDEDIDDDELAALKSDAADLEATGPGRRPARGTTAKPQSKSKSPKRQTVPATIKKEVKEAKDDFPVKKKSKSKQNDTDEDKLCDRLKKESQDNNQFREWKQGKKFNSCKEEWCAWSVHVGLGSPSSSSASSQKASPKKASPKKASPKKASPKKKSRYESESESDADESSDDESGDDESDDEDDKADDTLDLGDGTKLPLKEAQAIARSRKHPKTGKHLTKKQSDELDRFLHITRHGSVYVLDLGNGFKLTNQQCRELIVKEQKGEEVLHPDTGRPFTRQEIQLVKSFCNKPTRRSSMAAIAKVGLTTSQCNLYEERILNGHKVFHPITGEELDLKKLRKLCREVPIHEGTLDWRDESTRFPERDALPEDEIKLTDKQKKKRAKEKAIRAKVAAAKSKYNADAKEREEHKGKGKAKRKAKSKKKDT